MITAATWFFFLCHRCGGLFSSQTIARECFYCAGFGSVPFEMSGA
jgi:hypothetical protein